MVPDVLWMYIQIPLGACAVSLLPCEDYQQV
jgi:hypothetical protein